MTGAACKEEMMSILRMANQPNYARELFHWVESTQ